MATPVQQNLIAKNKSYAANFRQGNLALPPAKKYAVVTCMDARIDPAAAFGISLGDAHVIRNAGGSCRAALRDLVLSQQLLGTTEILVIKHTGCGMLTFKNEDAMAVVRKNLGNEAVWEVGAFLNGDFLPFGDLEKAVMEDIEWVRSSKLIPKSIGVSGWIYEVETGRVRRVA
ncbi:beta carbonic anhydrase clade D [Hyaloscypha variabilis F]|uniref:Carbonic anhydrase n=1 Tax=Hyaloscypha variabilis (strain UAMH 11265 / GT02V1 / F) TaxID=1149755 RepID=A0A2J6R289_HYAVF|nr:beta carbonic anhydrase clade D [Hyaloscypha variabilis F]